MKYKSMKAGTVCCCEAQTSLEAFMVSPTEDESQCRIFAQGVQHDCIKASPAWSTRCEIYGTSMAVIVFGTNIPLWTTQLAPHGRNDCWRSNGNCRICWNAALSQLAAILTCHVSFVLALRRMISPRCCMHHRKPTRAETPIERIYREETGHRMPPSLKRILLPKTLADKILRERHS